jgi:hypothetical protein
MRFTVTITGDVTYSGINTLDLLVDAKTALTDEVYIPYGTDLTFEDASVTEAVLTIEARARLGGIEVDAEDIEYFDADAELDDLLGYNAMTSGVEFEVTNSPSGFGLIEDMLGRENAISVYATLAKNGLEVV